MESVAFHAERRFHCERPALASFVGVLAVALTRPAALKPAAWADADGEATTAARGTPTVYERHSSVISCEWSTPQHKFVHGASVYEIEAVTPRRADGKRRQMAYLGWLPSARVGTSRPRLAREN